MKNLLKENALAVMAAFFAIGVWSLTFFVFKLPFGVTTYKSSSPVELGEYLAIRGTFGDMFGAANCLFSALIVIGIAWGVIQQKKELMIARESATLQNFHSAFFFLLPHIESKRNQLVYEEWSGDIAVQMLVQTIIGKDAKYTATKYLQPIWTALELIHSRPAEERQTWHDVLFSALTENDVELLSTFSEVHHDLGPTELVNKFAG